MFKDSKTFIIAEIGYNHNANFDKAKQLIDEVSKITAVDAIKFQIDSPDKIYSQKFDSHGYKFFSKIQLSTDENIKIFHHIKEKDKLPFLSISDDDLIGKLIDEGLTFIKLASSSLCNYKILDVIFKHKIPTIASIGMSDFKDVIDIYGEYQKADTPLSLMYCVSMYPTPVNNVSLNNISILKTLFPNIPIGYSDHTKKSEVVLAAVALGSKLIEVHVMLDNDSNAIEKDVSYTISELKELCTAIINVETILNPANDDRIILNKNLQKSRKSYFRGLFLGKDMKDGHAITLNNIEFKRPAIGVPSNLWKMVENRKLKKDKQKDEPLCWEDLE